MQRNSSKSSRGGPERYVLALALMVPLGLIAVMRSSLPGVGISHPSTAVYANVDAPLTTHRPPPSNSAPPPTLAPATATPIRPTPTPVLTEASTPAPKPKVNADSAKTYTVQPGDELKQIAAAYGVSIWKIIDANDIPNPDSLRVGQDLQIPDS
jgi:LysM repeat protein